VRIRASHAAGLAIAALALSGCGPSAAGNAAPSTPAATSLSPSPASSTTPVTTTAPPTTTGTPSTTATAPPTSTTTSPAPTVATTATTTATTTAVPAATATLVPARALALMAAGATGDTVRELQSRLKQLEWYDGDVTGTYATTTTAGVRGFQDRRGLAVTGSVDQLTWQRLGAMTGKPTEDEMHNRLTPGAALLRQGSTGDTVKELQARLKQAGWWGGELTGTYDVPTDVAVRAFQDKWGLPVTGEVDQRSIDRLRATTRTPTADELNNVKPMPPTPTPTAGLDPRCLTGHVICISKASRSLTWVVDGRAQRTMDVRFGSENTPTREGDFPVYRMNRDWTSTIFGSKMPYSMFFSGGEAVHYSSDFAARGYVGASHGCVNVRDLDGVGWLFDQVKVGDRAVVS